jgi:hypothetical protein
MTPDTMTSTDEDLGVVRLPKPLIRELKRLAQGDGRTISKTAERLLLEAIGRRLREAAEDRERLETLKGETR